MSEALRVALPVAAIIVSFGRCADLRRCLASLVTQSPALGRIIVVDNGSEDGTLEMVRGEFAGVELIASPENLGACVARNLAALHATEPFLWFLDSDTEVVGEGGAARMLAPLAALDVVAVGGEALLDAAGRSVAVKRPVVRSNGVVQGETVLEAEAEAQVLASCNLMLRRADFLAVGGFDPYYFFFYEDIDLTWRLGPRQLVLAPMPVLHHFSERMRVRRLWPEARNRMYFCIKNFAWPRLLAIPLNDLAFTLNPANASRLLRRAAKPGTANSLARLEMPEAPGKLRRLLLLSFATAAKFAMAYLALPVVLMPALRARRASPPLSPASLPPRIRGLLRQASGAR